MFASEVTFCWVAAIKINLLPQQQQQQQQQQS